MKRWALVALSGLLTALGTWLAPATRHADMCFGSGGPDEDGPADSGAAGAAGAVSTMGQGQGLGFGFVAAASIGMCWVFLRRSDREK